MRSGQRPIKPWMTSEPTTRGRFRWRRLIAAIGVLTSFVALAAIGHEGQPGVVSLWLLFAGLALAALDLAVGRALFPRVRALPLVPQLADHVAYGAIVGRMLDRRGRD